MAGQRSNVCVAMSTHLLIYDGECPLCRRSVEWVRRLDRRNRLEYVPFSGAPERLAAHPGLWPLDTDRVWLVSPDGQAVSGADALPELLVVTGRFPLLVPVLRHRFMLGLTRLGYRVLAPNRYRLSAWFAGCRHGACDRKDHS